MARIITCNTNGIRAAARKGFFAWLEKQAADVVCIQETKAQVGQLTDPVYFPEGYHCTYNDALKKGYSGTAVYSRVKPRKVITRLGWDPADSEGRYRLHRPVVGEARLKAAYPGYLVAEERPPTVELELMEVTLPPTSKSGLV